MAIQEQVTGILWADCVSVALVNVLTGSFQFVKLRGTAEETACLDATTMGEFMRRMVEKGCIHPADQQQYLSLADKDAFAALFSRVERKLVMNYRSREAEGYAWMTIEILLPETFSAKQPEVLFCWRQADQHYAVEQEAMLQLRHYFYKILRVNLTTDSYEIIKAEQQDVVSENGQEPSLSGWLQRFMHQGGVAEDDQEAYARFTDLGNLSEMFRSNCDHTSCKYRRKVEGGYRWSCMDLIPCADYTDEHQTIMLYVRDIHNSESTEMSYRRSLEYACNFDALTNVKNRRSYDELIAHMSRKPLAHDTGCLVAEVNGLEWRNKRLGRMAGDAYLQSFASTLSDEFGRNVCYRLSSDMFTVVLEGMDEASFASRMQRFDYFMRYVGQSMASVGTAWQPSGGSVDALIRRAETIMLAEKMAYDGLHPELQQG